MLLEEAIVPLKVSFLDNMFQCCTTLYQKMWFFCVVFLLLLFLLGPLQLVNTVNNKKSSHLCFLGSHLLPSLQFANDYLTLG